MMSGSDHASGENHATPQSAHVVFTRKCIGALAAGAGLLWTTGIVFSTSWFSGQSARDWWEWMMLLPFMALTLLILVPGVLLIFHGVRLFRAAVAHSLKIIFGTVAFLVVLAAGGRTAEWMSPSLPDWFDDGFFMLLAGAIAIPLYACATRSVMAQLTGRTPAHSELFGRNGLFLMALLLWLALQSVASGIIEAFPDNERYWFAGFVLPILIPMVAYHYARYCLSDARASE